MLDMNFIRNNLDVVKKKITAKGMVFDEKDFIKLDETRRQLITQSEHFRSEKKKLSKKIGTLKRERQETKNLEKQTKRFALEISKIEKKLSNTEDLFEEFMLNIPNLIDDSVPIGKDESENRVVREWGNKPVFDFKPKPHWELGETNGFLDLPRAAKITGSRFALYFGSLARLERCLIDFMIDVHTGENGYIEVLPPFLVNEKSLIGTGNLPKFKEDLFKIEDHDLYLVPTAEVPLTNIHRDEILDAEELPKSYVAYTPCFRSEAGSHGKDVRGIIRQHQFNKVELLKLTTIEDSNNELENLTSHAEAILKKLDLSCRVVLLCSGDVSFSSLKTYDIEVWMPAQGLYREISSCSNFESF
ncbi:MAG: serine--tRNA ligase, partial [Candidatus Aminicenantes bacterium]|nr:serine--tRNA ligase [Candidatus Aminicenantes bacterium]